MALLLTNHSISRFTVIALQELWYNPYMYTTHNWYNSLFYHSYLLYVNISFCFMVNKSLNPSSYSATLLTSKYGYLHMRSSVERSSDIMIYNVNHNKNLSPWLSEKDLPNELLSGNTHVIFPIFLLPFLILLLPMYGLETVTITTPIGEALVYGQTVLHNSSFYFTTFINSHFRYFERRFCLRVTIHKVLLILSFLLQLYFTYSQPLALRKTWTMGQNITLFEVPSRSLVI
jgi:hypothetical protein